MPPRDDRDIGIDTYGLAEPPDDEPPADNDDWEYDDDDPHRCGSVRY